jgi:signal transduction histidine kinase
MTVTRDTTEIDLLRQRVRELESEKLDIEEELERLQSQHDVLENVCFGVAREHERARALVEATRAELERSLAALRALTADQDEILAHVDQGILTLNTDGTINRGHSAAAARMLGRAELDGASLVELVADAPEARARLSRYIELSFSPSAQPKMLERLNPLKNLRLSIRGRLRVLNFSFARIADAEPGNARCVRKLLVVIDDRTAESELAERLERSTRDQVRRLETASQILALPPDVFEQFVKEADSCLEIALRRMEALAAGEGESQNLVNEAARVLHTLKGSARALNLEPIGRAVHEVEEALPSLATEQSIERVQATRDALERIRAELSDGNQLLARMLDFRRALTRASSDGNSELERTLRNVVRTEAAAVGKQVELAFENRMTAPLPAAALFRLKSALIQLVRNSIAHGVEAPESRERTGKPLTGTVRVRVFDSAQSFSAELSDDGHGIDVEALKRRAVERGLLSEDETRSLDERAALDLAFSPGLSTAERVTELSGRGVGLDVVRDSVLGAGGQLTLESIPGVGVSFLLELPKQRSAEEAQS